MKIAFPSATFFVAVLIMAALFALFGYFLFPVLGLEQTPGATLFASSLAIGTVAGGLLVGVMGSLGGGEPAAAGGSDTLKSIFVGNIAFRAGREELQELFAKYGTVHSTRIMTDRATRRPRGFGFVEMSERDANKAIKALDGYEFFGRKLRVNEGKQRREA